jgi:hypothetical protein
LQAPGSDGSVFLFCCRRDWNEQISKHGVRVRVAWKFRVWIAQRNSIGQENETTWWFWKSFIILIILSRKTQRCSESPALDLKKVPICRWTL